MFSDFHFVRPIWLLALIPLAVLIWRWSKAQNSAGNWQKVVDPHLLPYVLKTQDQIRRRLFPILGLLLSGVLLIVAMAGPVWQRWPQPVYGTEDPLVIALDLSTSMDAADIRPSRLGRARHKIRDLLRMRPDGQTALLVYAAQAFVVTPLTQDTGTIAALVPVLETQLMPEQGTRPDVALEQALELLKQSDANSGDILLITDGLDEVDVSSEVDDIRNAGHRVSVLGVGTQAGAPIPNPQGGFITNSQGAVVVSKLQNADLSDLAGSGYATITANNDDLLSLLNVMTPDQSGGLQPGLKTDVWREEGPWLLLLVIPLAALVFRRGVITVLMLMLVLPIQRPVEALEWSDLWQRRDQRGAAALADGDYDRAADLLKDPNWKATAEYRGGDFPTSAELWESVDTPDGHYNQGNALALQGPELFEQAIASYEKALNMDPNHEDARYNRDLLLQQQQQQQNQDQQQDQEEQENESDDQEDSEGEQESQQQQQSEEQEAEEEKETEVPYDEEFEADQADEQWLRKIPDDPGGLLRRKFRYQYRRRNPSENRSTEAPKW